MQTSAIRFQYDLVIDRSFKFGPLIGTHNAFISRANGLGLTEDLASAMYARTLTTADAHVRIPNQRYGPQTLLNIGVRELELDLWDISWDGFKTWDVYLCHSPVPDPDEVIALQAAADRLGMGTLNYDPFYELCSRNPLSWGLQQITDWLAAAGNSEQVVALFLDNRVAMSNIDLVSQAITSALGSALMTPSDVSKLFNGSFPSRRQMLAAGKRAYCESNSYFGNDYSNTSLAGVCFYPTTWTNAQLDDSTIEPFPNCTADGTGWTSWYGVNFTRVLDSGDLAWSPAEEVETSIIYKPNGIADLVACGFNNIGVADLSPAAAVGFVWSFAPGQPSAANGTACRAAAMTLVRGQWTAQPCATAYPAVCRYGDNRIPAGNKPQLWNITSAPVTFSDAAAACAALGPGWAFDVPRDGRENALIAQRALMNGLWAAAPNPGFWLNVPL